MSLWQPWASLLVAGRKRVETRSWAIRHRGPLLIHAAKKWDADLEALCYTNPFEDALFDLGLFASKSVVEDWNRLPFGAIVGRVDVVDCFPTDWVKVDDVSPFWYAEPGKLLTVTTAEKAFGDYRDGRFAFLCENPVVFKTPIGCRGHQGLFDVPDELVAGAVP